METTSGITKLPLFPQMAAVNDRGHLVIGGCDAVFLAAEFGTPLYLFDELHLRRRCAEFREEFGQRYAGTRVVYAAKAFINQGLARLFAEEGLSLDVVSGGELSIARAAGFPLDRVYFHGNNKSAEELGLALEWGVGRIVVDNFYELSLLDEIAGERGQTPDILLRLSPGVDPHTHQYIATGVIDSKFGFPLLCGDEAISQAMAAPNLNLVGLHFHLGSLIIELEPYRKGVDALLSLAYEARQGCGFELKELDIGGGFAIQYELDKEPPPIAAFAEVVAESIQNGCRERGLPLPELTIEPGRSLVGQAGVALYRAGVVKDIPGVRCYVCVDGGMGDNIRPALYGSRYEVVVANRMTEKATGKVTVAGKYCESGDILVRDAVLPSVLPGDIIALPSCGAYCLSMASNYNASLKPAIVVVRDGQARLIRRRETFEDLTRCDLI